MDEPRITSTPDVGKPGPGGMPGLDKIPRQAKAAAPQPQFFRVLGRRGCCFPTPNAQRGRSWVDHCIIGATLNVFPGRYISQVLCAAGPLLPLVQVLWQPELCLGVPCPSGCAPPCFFQQQHAWLSILKFEAAGAGIPLLHLACFAPDSWVRARSHTHKRSAISFRMARSWSAIVSSFAVVRGWWSAIVLSFAVVRGWWSAIVSSFAVARGWWSAIVSSFCCGQGLVVSYCLIILAVNTARVLYKDPFAELSGKKYIRNNIVLP